MKAMVHERIDPHKDENIMRLSRLAHIKRYQKAAEIMGMGKSVLDAGCGFGYGTFILGGLSSGVVGVDVSPEAISYARNNYRLSNIEFCQKDLTCVDCSLFGKFDAITCFEVLEHISNPYAALENFKGALKDDGQLIISVPNGKNAPDNNSHHLMDYSPRDLEDLLGQNGFNVKQKFGQYPVVGSLAGAAGKITGYQSCTNKDSGIIPRMIDAVPFLPEVFSNLYESRLAVSTGRTIYYVAGLKK
jgi:SAM-dependent methyltransferase